MAGVFLTTSSPVDEVAAIRESIIATTAKHRNPHAPAHIGHVPGIINYDQSFAPYLADGRLMTLLKGVLGAHVRISMTTGTVTEPGNTRGDWHADWPFNQRNAGSFPTPYPDIVAHITTIWMLAPFTAESGGTLVVSGSHRMDNNPTGNNGVDPSERYPTEINATGDAGSVLVMDSRLWHANRPQHHGEPARGPSLSVMPPGGLILSHSCQIPSSVICCIKPQGKAIIKCRLCHALYLRRCQKR